MFGRGSEEPHPRTGGYNPERLDAICRRHWSMPRCALEGLEEFDLPYTIKPKLYMPIRNIMRGKISSVREANRLAYKAYLLFESADNVRYFHNSQKTLFGMQESLPALLSMIIFPPMDTWKDVGFRRWGRAFTQHSVDKMNTVFPRLGPILEPEKQGNRISLVATEFTHAAKALEGTETGRKLQVLLDVANYFGKNDNEFERAWKAYVHMPEETNVTEDQSLPDIVIDGAKFGMAGALFRRLDKDDPRILFVGDYTQCCERVTDKKNNLERNVVAAIHSDTCGYYVVERDGDILAHSLAYRGTSKELVFDGFESNPYRFGKDDYENLAHAIERHFKTESPLGIYRVLVGQCAKHLSDIELETYPGTIHLVKPAMLHNKVGIVHSHLRMIV